MYMLGIFIYVFLYGREHARWRTQMPRGYNCKADI